MNSTRRDDRVRMPDGGTSQRQRRSAGSHRASVGGAREGWRARRHRRTLGGLGDSRCSHSAPSSSLAASISSPLPRRPAHLRPLAAPSSPASRSDLSMAPPHSTLRLPAPPPPPKPLHLTMSMRGAADKKSAYPQMPRWSRAESDEDSGGTVRGNEGRGAEDDDEEDGDDKSPGVALFSGLFLQPGGEADEFDSPSYSTRRSKSSVQRRRDASSSAGASGSYRSAQGTLRGSTIKGARRASIFFDATLLNPLVAPEPIPSSVPSSSPPPSSSPDHEHFTPTAFLTTEPSDADTTDDADPNQLELPPALLALSLHAFEGESAFGELSFAKNVELYVEVEDLGGGWSLGYVKEAGEGGRGLIPRGWFAVSLCFKMSL
jgi:hypothetical protein